MHRECESSVKWGTLFWLPLLELFCSGSVKKRILPYWFPLFYIHEWNVLLTVSYSYSYLQKKHNLPWLYKSITGLVLRHNFLQEREERQGNYNLNCEHYLNQKVAILHKSSRKTSEWPSYCCKETIPAFTVAIGLR